jgi:hypothetical protein
MTTDKDEVPGFKSSQAHHTGFDQRKRLSLGFGSAGECASLVGHEVGGSAALSKPARLV